MYQKVTDKVTLVFFFCQHSHKYNTFRTEDPRKTLR